MNRAARLHPWLAALLLLLSLPLHALEPGRTISQYGHRTWRLRDGELPAPAYPVAQTRDGYLWVGTQAGLVRFDGLRFVPLREITPRRLPSEFVTALLAARDGSLWIATPSGMSHLTGNDLVDVRDMKSTSALLEDAAGTIWATTTRNRDETSRELALCRIADDAATCYGSKDGLAVPIEEQSAGSLVQDRDGWYVFITELALYRWKPGTTATRIADEPKRAAAVRGRLVFAASSTRQWVGVDTHGPGLGLQHVENGVIVPATQPLQGSTLAVQALFVDSRDVLWIGTLDDGIYRIDGDTVDHFSATDGLSSDCIYWFYEDAAGSLWVTTSEGLDQFRDLAVSTFSRREGRSVAEADSVVATRDGRIWVGAADALDIYDRGRFTAFKHDTGLPGHQVTSMLQDRAGTLWIGVDNRLFTYDGKAFTPVDPPDGKPFGMIFGLVEDAQGDIWATYPKTLARIRDRQVQERFPAVPSVIVADPQSGIWIASVGGKLAHHHDGSVDRFEFADTFNRARRIIATADGALVVATDAGLRGWREGTQRRLGTANGLPCESANEMLFDTDGNLWVLAECGLLRIAAADIARWWADGSAVMQPMVFDALDGVRVGRPAFRAMAQAADGRIWFANGVNLQVFDPAAIVRAAPAPLQVHIERLRSNRQDFPPAGPVVLPPNPRDIEIDYTATSLAAPQRTRFRYRLEGHDIDWQEAGPRRQALYNDLRPAAYRFVVAASDDGGRWHETAAPLAFTVDAAWYQTSWFHLLAVLAVIAIAALAWRLRVRRIAAQINARFDERLAERTRLARDLHDTLLQTIQGTRLVADDAAEREADVEHLRQSMQRIAQWLGTAVREAREVLHALRLSAETSDLAEGLRRASEDCAATAAVDATFRVTGTPRDMHPIAQDEIYRIATEAIRNACAHSQGSRVDVTLAYGAGDLVVTVRDDGRGFDTRAARSEAEGHYGLRGMHERAARIGAMLRVEAAAPSGTTVTLVVPASAAYHADPERSQWRAGLRRFLPSRRGATRPDL